MIELLIVLVVVGVLLWLVNTYVPLQPPINTILNVIVVVAVIIWVLQFFGLFNAHLNWHRYHR